MSIKGWTHAKVAQQTALAVRLLQEGRGYTEVAAMTGYSRAHAEGIGQRQRFGCRYDGLRATDKRPAIPARLREHYVALTVAKFSPAEAARIVLADRPATR